MAKKAKTAKASAAELKRRKARKDLRMPEFKKWCETLGFSGIFKAAAPAFIAHQLGVTEPFVREVMAGRANFSSALRSAMRAISRDHHVRTGWEQIRFGLFTSAIDLEKELVALGASPPPPEGDETAREESGGDSSEELKQALRGATKNVVLVLTVEGKTHVVSLPRGAAITGEPTVVHGRGGKSGSIQIVFTKASPRPKK